MPPREIHHIYKGVQFAVSDSAGYYRFWFKIAGQTFRGRTETKLAGVALRRVQGAIDRKLREARQVTSSNETS
jgi:hypothetical protein